MRTLDTDAEREEAAALVQDRQRWLTMLVRTEILARHVLEAEPLAALLRRLTDVGWDVQGSGPGREGDRVARLELAAESRSGSSALIGCRVHEPQAAPDDRGGA